MKSGLWFFMMALVFISGCASTTPVNKLALPPVTAIEGSVSQISNDGFTLTDESGSIFVRAKLPEGKKLNLTSGEKVKVFGNLQGGQEKIFDGYVIRNSNSEQMIVSKPSPHFGFILQSSFK